MATVGAPAMKMLHRRNTPFDLRCLLRDMSLSVLSPRFSVLVFAFLLWPAGDFVRAAEAATGKEGEHGIPRLLTTAKQVRQLSLKEAGYQLPVRIRGVVTFHDPAWFLTFVQDESAGIYVAAWKGTYQSPGLSIGQLVEVEGVTSPGLFAPFIDGVGGSNATMRILGTAPLPPAAPLSTDPGIQPSLHSQRVEVRGVVRAISEQDGRVAVEIDTRAGRIKALVPELNLRSPLPTPLVGARIRATGVFGSIFNQRRQLTGMMLFVPALADLEIERAALPDAFTLPVRPISSLLQFQHDEADYRVRVQGVVVLQQPGTGLYIRGEGGGLWVQTRQLTPVTLGESIDVVGFPSVADFTPLLQDAEFRSLKQGPLPAPIPVTSEEALAGGHHADLVTLEALLLEERQTPEEQVLVLQAGQTVFQARLASGLNQSVFTDPAIGSVLRVTGICLVKSAPTPPDKVAPLSFNLLLRSPADVTLLKSPAWWTAQRVRRAALTLVLAIAVVLAWVALLGQRVRAQTKIIRRQLELEMLHEERTRIARDLHDTLEQELVGITLQLDAAAARLVHSPEAARESLDVARDMVRHSQTEAHQSIWDLRSRALESGGLIPALASLLQPLSNGSPLKIEIKTKGSPRRLPAPVENNLLRVAQEAVTNTLKHAAATSVVVEVDYGDAVVRVQITDNGRGFTASNPTAIETRHFGLLGMRERVERMNGQIEIRSQPSQGTTVSVQVPIPHLPARD